MEQTKFTVFVKSSRGWDGHASTGRTLAEVIACAALPIGIETFTPIAWIAGDLEDGGYEKYRAESIAAGRVIELVDGKYVPRGVPGEQTKAQFRIGGVYRNGYNTPCRLEECGNQGEAAIVLADQDALLWTRARLSDGRNLPITMDGDPLDLLPGELHCVNGEWVSFGTPIQPEKPAQPDITGACGVSWDELQRGKRFIRESDASKPTPLPYFTEQQERARWNPFADFTVTSGTQEQAKPVLRAEQRCADLEPRGLMVR